MTQPPLHALPPIIKHLKRAAGHSRRVIERIETGYPPRRQAFWPGGMRAGSA
jgi:hypothetical protein